MSIYRSDEEVRALVRAFEDRTLPKSEWTHAAHLTVGMHYCLENPPGLARNLMRDGIHWLNEAHGTPNTEDSGYHETLTCFWIDVIRRFLAGRDRGEGLSALANSLVAEFGDPKLPFSYYSRQLLFSPEARFSLVAPDLRPCDIL